MKSDVRSKLEEENIIMVYADSERSLYEFDMWDYPEKRLFQLFWQKLISGFIEEQRSYTLKDNGFHAVGN